MSATTTPAPTRLRATVRIPYSLGSLATGAFGTVPGLLLLPYLTDVLGVAAGLGGFLVLLPKLWDAVWNPFVGRISDRTAHRWGPRMPYILFGGLGAGILFAAIFAGALGTSSWAPLWVVAAFIACATAYGLFQVTFSVLPAELSDDPSERTRLISLRIGVLALAILLSGGISPIIVGLTPDDPIAGYRNMGVFVGLLFVVGALSVFFGTRRVANRRLVESEPSIAAQFAVVARNGSFRALLICFVIQGAGIATILAGVNYFADDVLHDAAAKTFLFVAFVAPAILTTPLWTMLRKRIGAIPAFIGSSGLFVLGALLIAVAAWTGLPSWAVYVAVVLVGVGYAGEQVYAIAMLADVIAEDETASGRQRGGVFAGVWTAGEHLGYALGPAIFGLFLQASGYVSTVAGQDVTQPDSVRGGVILGFCVAPAALVAAGLILLRWFRARR